MQKLLAQLIHAREEDEDKDKDIDDLEDEDLDEDDEDFEDDDDDWDDDDEEEEEEEGASRRERDYAPATVMRAILSVGAAIAVRMRRSLPTISMSRSMSRRFPAMVNSSTGWASSPFSIHSPAAPRE